MPHSVAGVDGCQSGWIAAVYDTEQSKIDYCTHADFITILQALSGVMCIGVDIPIGLSESFQPRRCDQLARSLIRTRSSSVFPAPDRRLLRFAELEYGAANGYSREYSGKGLTRQSFAIFEKIDQVDRVMTPRLQANVFEVHPEVCFWAAADKHPLRHPKRKREGFEERREILNRVLPGVVIPTFDEAKGIVHGAKPDDVLDAIAAAWTAWRNARGLSERIPVPAELDARGLRMEIVY